MFRALSVVGRSLRLFFVYGLGKPLVFIIGFFLKPVAITLYKLYRFLKKEYLKLNLPTGQKFFQFFTHKYFVHFIIIVLTLSVASNSLSAREIKLEEFGKKTLFSALVASDQNQETIEGVETVLAKSNYLERKDALRARVTPTDDSIQITETTLVTTEEGTALVKNTLPDTSLTGQPRENIESYQVKGGDTISTIAGQFGISTNTILWANSLNSTDLIKPGQTLTIPPVSGVLYKIQKGDTVASLAKKYKADEKNILEYNQLADASAIEVGDQIMIPGGEIEPPPPAPKKTTSGFASIFSGNAPPSARVSEGSRLLWPTPSHKINQYYRWGHQAIDIDGNYSSPIYAAEDGTAEKVGQGTGYGNVIIISHGGGKKTVYAHLSKFFIKQGQAVSKGQTIGMMGCTGWCTGTHLHFEVVISGSKVNPLSYL
ncbi:MAG: peptidoglycan DD-metalloendopeptidase family protein [Patescibacteria group bacterium]